MALNIQVSESRCEDWYNRPPASVAKSVTSSPHSGGPRPSGCSFRGLPGDSRPTHIRSDISSISRGIPCTPGLSPEKVIPREPPKMGEGGNWQCHVCLNVNYPRRTACNRCLAERSKENTQKVAEFVRLKESFLQMGLDQQTASAAAAAQQAAHSCVSPGTGNGAMLENVERLHSGSNGGSSSGSVLALDNEGLRLLSYPLEQLQQQHQRPLFDQASLRRLLQQPAPGLTACSEKQQQLLQQQDSCGSFKAPGMSSRETSGDMMRSSSSGSNSGESSSACLSDEDVVANSLSRLSAAMRLGSGGSGSCNQADTEMQFVVLTAGMLLGRLLRELDEMPYQQQCISSAPVTSPSVLAKAEEVLRAALEMLTGNPATEDRQQLQASSLLPPVDALPPTTQQHQQRQQHQLGYPQMLAHPDEFRNPSSFLKIYGDPLCSLSPTSAATFVAGGTSTSPAANRDGNWVCACCNNINFPRRFRCNKCNELRGPEGDKIVAEYARAVYALHAERIRTQQLQQQLQQLQQQDMQQMQMQMEQLQMQQQRQQRIRQRQRMTPSSLPSSPLGGSAPTVAKSFSSAIAAAAAANASIAAAKSCGTSVLRPKIGGLARSTAHPAAAAPDTSSVAQQQQPPKKLVKQEDRQQTEEEKSAEAKKDNGKIAGGGKVGEEQQQSNEKQKKQEAAAAPAAEAASVGSLLLPVHANGQ